jgi:hypothetical protein
MFWAFYICQSDEVKVMQRSQLLASLTTVLCVGGSVLAEITSVRAEQQKFFCGTSDGIPATMASTSRGPVPVIRWVSSLAEGEYSPQTRCQSVSERFQRYYEAGQLNYLTTGTENGSDIICVTVDRGGDCAGTLFTLKPGSSPEQTLKQLFGAQNSIGPLNEGTPRIYVAMEEVLRKSSVDDLQVQGSPIAPRTNQSADTTESISW